MKKNPQNIPFVDLKAGFASIKHEIMKAIEDVLNEMHLYLGPNCQELEREFAAYCNTQFAIGVGSGTEALQFALLAHGVKTGEEVITSPLTFFATAEAIVSTGATPVFADIDPITYTIDPVKLEKKISGKTRAIIPVHMYGQVSDMQPIAGLAKKHGIHVIEDACQAHGALYGDKKAGSIGNAGCFSFYFTKNLGGYGEGGMVTTNDPQIAETVKLYRNHGHKAKFEHSVFGYNGRLDELQAAILRIKLKYLDSYTMRRREIAERYTALLKDTPLTLPREAPNRRHVYHLYVVRSKKRDALQDFLSSRGIGTGIHYRKPIHLQEAARDLGYRNGDLPETEAVCDEILSLPMYPELDQESQEYIAHSIKDFYSN
jgi:dTDP-4-amino-4,6-dideoxygalactose transaminase